MNRTALLVALLALLAAPAGADEAYEREVKEAKEKLAQLLRKADELQAAGRTEDAAEVRRKAEDLRAELHAFVKRHEGGKDRDVLEGLERGILALRKLGREDEARRLEEIARDVRGGGHNKEKEILEGWIEIMKPGVHALAEAGRGDAAERLEQGIHAFRVAAAGRTDEEARMIRKRAPDKGEMGELMMVAAELLAHKGDKERANRLGRLGREFAAAGKRPQPDNEREIVKGWIRLMRVAMGALLEAGREDAAHRLEHGIHALELGLEGRRDEEAVRIRESAPPRPELGEILMAAADHLAHRGRHEEARAVDELGKRWRELELEEPAVRFQGEQARKRAPERDEAWGRAMERIERLEERMKGLERGLERIAASLRELHQDLRRDR